jgi:hypothetical protein
MSVCLFVDLNDVNETSTFVSVTLDIGVLNQMLSNKFHFAKCNAYFTWKCNQFSKNFAQKKKFICNTQIIKI